jgi:hypothetical protein
MRMHTPPFPLQRCSCRLHRDRGSTIGPTITAPKCDRDNERMHALSSHLYTSGRKPQLMLCTGSMGIQSVTQRSHLFSLSPQRPLLRSITEFSFKSPLIPRKQSQPSRGIVRIVHLVSHKSHYHISSGIHRPKIHQIGLTHE